MGRSAVVTDPASADARIGSSSTLQSRVSASCMSSSARSAAVLAEEPMLSRFAGYLSDSGEGRWTIHAAIDQGVPVPVVSAALYGRFNSRGNADFQNKVLSAMRFQFGEHGISEQQDSVKVTSSGDSRPIFSSPSVSVERRLTKRPLMQTATIILPPALRFGGWPASSGRSCFRGPLE